MNNRNDIQGFLKAAERPTKGYGLRRWYLATPYSHPDDTVVQQRVEIVRFLTAGIIKQHSADDIVPISPILYTDRLQELVTPQFGWYRFDFFLLDMCDVLKVCKLPGWEDSEGIRLEIAHALGCDIPIDYLNPEPYLEAMKSDG